MRALGLSCILTFKQKLCDNCAVHPPFSPTTEPPKKTTPPELTIALAVEISKNGGRIKFFDSESDVFKGDVSAEEFDNIVVVPWNSRWYFYSIGSLSVRYIEKI